MINQNKYIKISYKKSICKFKLILILLFVGILFILINILINIETVNASGSGNYPPPEEGDWIISNTTIVENENITLKGHLIVYSNLTLKNVILNIDYNNTGNYYGNLLIYGNLTFRNTTLTMELNRQNITVYSNGSFYIYDYDNNPNTTYDKSIINGVQEGFYFYVKKNSSFIIKNSEINNCVEFYIEADNTIIENNMFSYISNTGIWFNSSSNNIFKNNMVSGSWSGITLDYSSNNLIINNTFNDTFYGIITWDSNNNQILNNKIYNNMYGIIFSDSNNNNTIANNTIYNDYTSSYTTTYYGILLYSSTNNQIKQNTIYNIEYDGIRIEYSNYNQIIENNIYNCYRSGIRIKSSTLDKIINNTISSDKYDFFLETNSQAIAINNIFNGSKVFVSSNSKLTVKNYLQIQTIDANNFPIPNSLISIKDNNIEIFNTTTNQNGLTSEFLITDRIYDGSNNATENLTTVQVFYENFTFSNNPRNVSMENSHTEIFQSNNSIVDLTPISISIPANYYENEIIEISSLIKNIGYGFVNNFTVSLIINNQTIQTKTFSLTANSSSLISFNWTVLKGNHEIKISIDKENKIIELNETNNEIKTFISVLPDLTPSLFTSHERILIGDNMTIFAIVKNIGNANAENFVVKFYIDGIDVRNFTISLNFNENATLSFNYTFEKGNHTIKVVVDEEDLILELNEGNNNASLGIVGNERINGNVSSFYMNIFIIIGVAWLVGIVRKLRRN